MRKAAAIVTLLALLASPTVAQARVFCRYTGVEITNCEEQRVPERPVVQAQGCCESRVAVPLGPARTSTESATVAPVLIVVTAPLATAPLRPFAPDHSLPPRASGPPLYVVQRALLI